MQYLLKTRTLYNVMEYSAHETIIYVLLVVVIISTEITLFYVHCLCINIVWLWVTRKDRVMVPNIALNLDAVMARHFWCMQWSKFGKSGQLFLQMQPFLLNAQWYLVKLAAMNCILHSHLWHFRARPPKNRSQSLFSVVHQEISQWSWLGYLWF